MGWERELRDALVGIIWEIPDRVGVLFSGGLDSSFLAYLINMMDKSVHLYSAGTPTSHDIDWTREAAEMLGLPVKFLCKSDEEIMDGIRSIRRVDRGCSPLELLIELPLFFVMRDSSDEVLISGQGADELFLGYKKYESNDTSADDLEIVSRRMIPLEARLAREFDKTVIYPYLDPKIKKLAKEIPYDDKIRDGHRKYALRKIASDFGLSQSISWKPKKASQYSSGFAGAVKRMASVQGKEVHEFINAL